MLLLWWLLFGVCLRETEAWAAKTGNSSIAYFSGNAFAIYEPWDISGKMTFVFKTQSQSGLLFHQDDGNYEYMKVQLNSKGLEMEVNLGSSCQQRKFLIQGNFADSEWHQVLPEGSPDIFNLSVDGRFLRIINCMQESPVNPALSKMYVRSYPRSLNVNSLACTSAFYREYYPPESYRSFIGCLGRFQYSDTAGTLHDVKMHSSSGVRACGAECPTKDYCQETGLQKISDYGIGAKSHAEVKPVMGKDQVLPSQLINALPVLVAMTASPSVAMTTVSMVTLTSPRFESLPLTRVSWTTSAVSGMTGMKRLSTMPEESRIGGSSSTRVKPTRRLSEVYGDSINLSLVQRPHGAFQTRNLAPYGLTFSESSEPPFASHSDQWSPTSQVGYKGSEHTAQTTRFSIISPASSYKMVQSSFSLPTLSQMQGTIDKDKKVLAQRSRSSGGVLSDRIYSLGIYVALMMCM